MSDTRGTKLVWVVDDSAVDAERARRALEPHFRVEVLADGSAALERLSQGPSPAAMVLDWVMPGVTGVDVCHFVRSAGPRLRDVGLVLLTVNDSTSQVVEGLSAGADDYLAKPFQEEELRARVVAVVRARAGESRDELAARDLLAGVADPLLVIDARGRVAFANDEARRAAGGEACAGLEGRALAEVVPGLADCLGRDALSPLPDVTLAGRTYAPVLRRAHDTGGSITTFALRDVTEARQDEARRSDFYAMLAHDLRSPLSATILRLGVMLRGGYGPMTPGLLENARKMDASLKSLVTMISDFMDFAQLQGGGYKVQWRPVDMSALVDAVMEELGPLVELHRLTWRAARPAQPAVALGDPDRLRQVVTNLIANAIKFTPDQGAITTTVSLGDGWVEVAVEDTGRGISPQALPSIFQRYTREIDPEHQVAGSGLGLLIVSDIIRAHGGTVGVSSHPGQGSRFWFRLSAVRDAPEGAAPPG